MFARVSAAHTIMSMRLGTWGAWTPSAIGDYTFYIVPADNPDVISSTSTMPLMIYTNVSLYSNFSVCGSSCSHGNRFSIIIARFSTSQDIEICTRTKL